MRTVVVSLATTLALTITLTLTLAALAAEARAQAPPSAPPDALRSVGGGSRGTPIPAAGTLPRPEPAPPPPPVAPPAAEAAPAAGETVVVDLRYRNEWTVERYTDPLEVHALLTLAPAGGPASDGALRLRATLEPLLVAYDRPGYGWQWKRQDGRAPMLIELGPAELPPRADERPVASPPAREEADPTRPFAEQLALATEALGGSLAVAGGRTFEVEVPEAGGVRVRPTRPVATPIGGAGAGEAALARFVAAAVRLVRPSVGASIEVSDAPAPDPGPRRSAAGAAPLPLRMRAVDGMRMQRTASASLEGLGAVEVYDCARDGDARGPGAVPFTLAAVAGIGLVSLDDAGSVLWSAAGAEGRAAARDPGERFRLDFACAGGRAVSAFGRLYHGGALGWAGLRRLLLQEQYGALERSPGAISLRAYTTWEAKLVAIRPAVAP